MICESTIANTEAFPSTYSAREKGRQKYNGSAPLARSGEIRPGPVKAVSTNASTPCTIDESEEEIIVDFENRTADAANLLQETQIVGRRTSKSRQRERKEEAQHEQRRLQFRAEQFSPRIAKQHQAARPRRSQRARHTTCRCAGKRPFQLPIAFRKISSSVSRRKFSRRMRTSRSAAIR